MEPLDSASCLDPALVQNGPVPGVERERRKRVGTQFHVAACYLSVGSSLFTLKAGLPVFNCICGDYVQGIKARFS